MSPEKKRKSEIRKKLRTICKDFKEDEVPILIAAQINEELVVEAIVPGELGLIDPYDRFSRMLAGSSNFNINSFK